jgi:ABC-type transport system involved in multi-copper enzyme maturation permease subunit
MAAAGETRARSFNARMMWAIAGAEMRSTRRLARYWVFSVLAVIIALLIYAYTSVLHGMFSAYSGTVGSMSPRLLVAASGMYMLVIFLVGLIFLAFDVRARDERERMAEVLDVRPPSNSEYIFGRSLALVIMSWIPVLVALAIMQGFGGLSRLNGWPVGDLLQPHSIVGFLIYSVTALVVWCSVVIFISVAVRHRLGVIVASLGALGLQFWVTFQLPVYLQPVFSILPTFDMASDMVPLVLPPGTALHMGALWSLAAALLMLAAALFPRSDGGSKQRRLAIGGGLLTLSVACFGLHTFEVRGPIDERRAWLAVHEQHQNDPRMDIESITGRVVLDPGRSVAIDIELRGHSGSEAGDSLTFAFNPGFTITRLAVNGAAAGYQHADGILRVTAPAGGKRAVSVAITAAGQPDLTFGYLDTAFDFYLGDLMSSQLFLLGYEISNFSSEMVALMPGSRWLPIAGSDVPSDDPRGRATDYFKLDLEVEVPDGWLVAGPGRRDPVPGKSDSFRFNPKGWVYDIALIASEFARRSVEIDGLELEVLVHPDHVRNLEFFSDAEGAIKDRVQEMMTEARTFNLAYPYESLTLVEVPNRLRGYGGDWRMDTVQTMPGMLLLRETGFPTARFDRGFDDPAKFEDKEGGMAGAKVEVIERFFENDFSGGNLFTGVSRHFLRSQTSAEGDGAIALNWVLDEMASQLLTDKRGYFSAHEFASQANILIGKTMVDMGTGRAGSVAEALVRNVTNRPTVWDRALGDALADLDPHDHPGQSINVMALKGSAVARSIIDGIGRGKTGHLLASLRSRYAGETFTTTEFNNLAVELGIDLPALLGDWLRDAALPGFLVSELEAYRLADDKLGNPRYQMKVSVRNDEATPGLFTLRYAHGTRNKTIHDSTDPIRVPGNSSVDVGVITSSPVREVWMRPYLSLNRHQVRVPLPRGALDRGRATSDVARLVEIQSDAEPFSGVFPSDWEPPRTSAIVVDDLDGGFVVHSDRLMDGSMGGAADLQGLKLDLDQGLPAFHPMFGPPQVWSRSEVARSFGKYRHTQAIIGKGDGSQSVSFSADLPHSGQWALSLYLDLSKGTKGAAGALDLDLGAIFGADSGRQLGTYDIAVISAQGDRETVDFDASAAEPGWNTLAELDLGAGEARVEITNETTGLVVIADAIRWQSSRDQR